MESQDYSICTACGTQYDSRGEDPSLPPAGDPSNCKICDDPRQFVPAEGQRWTTLREMKQNHHNQFTQDAVDKSIWSISTKPKFAIGQRAILLVTKKGNVLWDLVTCLNGATIDFVRTALTLVEALIDCSYLTKQFKKIKSKGRLDAIVISHPHYYTAYVEWAKAFQCPVYVSKEDKQWLCLQLPPSDDQDGSIKFLEGPPGTTQEIIPEVTAIKAGGHFPGSLVLHWKKKLFIADTIVTTPSAFSPDPRPPGQNTFTFQWSIPNMIPLPPSEILKIWRAIEPFEFDTTHGAFLGIDIRHMNVKARVLESMKIQVRNEGYEKHEILEINMAE